MIAFCQVKGWTQFQKINLDLAKLNTAIEMLDDTWTTDLPNATSAPKANFNYRKINVESNAIQDWENI